MLREKNNIPKSFSVLFSVLIRDGVIFLKRGNFPTVKSKDTDSVDAIKRIMNKWPSKTYFIPADEDVTKDK